MLERMAQTSFNLPAMLFSPRISLAALARLCRRLATSLQAGVDVRTVCAREAQYATGLAARPRFRQISNAVHQGDSLAEAIDAAGDYFPPLFREMTNVGEKTGHLSEIFTRLAENYEEQIRLRRIFLVAISWPMVQLAISVLIVGALIWIIGMVNPDMDPLGFGLVGNSGLAVYVMFVAGVTAVIVFVIHALRRGVAWVRPVQKAVLRIPVLGKAVETICLARVAWSLHLTLGVGMDVRQAIRLSLGAARNARYTDHIPAIEAAVESGDSIHDAFLAAGDYPVEFLDNLRVGEESGNLAESMDLLSRQYHERAAAALKIITMLAGFAVWMAIAALIIAIIFRIFFTAYLNPYRDLMNDLNL
jgi:type IV pilus assembly protein PilC